MILRTVNPQRVENRRRQILDAARYCFEQKGFHATSMAEICARAEMSPGALYRYFSSKEEIIVAMSEETNFQSIDSLRTKTEEVKNGNNFLEAIHALLAEIAETNFSKEQGALCAESISEAMRNTQFANAASVAYLEYQELFSQLLELGKEQGALDKEQDTIELAAVLMAIVDGMVLRMAFDSEFKSETAVKWIGNLFCRYLTTVGKEYVSNNFGNPICVVDFKNTRFPGGQFDE